MTNLKRILQYRHARTINLCMCVLSAPFFGLLSILAYLCVEMLIFKNNN